MPADPAGAVTVSKVPSSALMAALAVPKSTLVAPERWVPVILTAVPPLVGPDLGLIRVTVGMLLVALCNGRSAAPDTLVVKGVRATTDTPATRVVHRATHSQLNSEPAHRTNRLRLRHIRYRLHQIEPTLCCLEILLAGRTLSK